jgi:two-component system sensor histidine kinase TctE
MRSLTGTLYRRVILGTVVVLLIAGTILYISVTRQLIRQMDESLTDKVKTLALSIEEKPYGLEVDLEEMRAEDMEEAESPEYLSIGFPDGRIIYRSSVFNGIDLTGFNAPPTETSHGWSTVKGVGKVRSVHYSFQPGVDEEEEEWGSIAADTGIVVVKDAVPGDRVIIQLFRDTSNHTRFTEIFLLVLIGTGLGSIGVLSLTVWITIKKGAEPINELAARIEDMRDDDLADRLDEKTVLNELLPIARKFNLFLDRLEESFTRERGFTSDAAHELRTPLAGLKSTIEVALTRERATGEYRATLQRALEMVHQLENLVESLLALARLESGQESSVVSHVHLQRFVSEVWGAYGSKAGLKNLEVSLNLNNSSASVIDRNLMTHVLDELFKNAVHYVDQGGFIRVDLFQDGSASSIRVSNSGSRVRGQDAERVFDRFWRGSESRDDTGTRFGLGLPIVRKMVQTMGGELEIETELGEEFRVTVTLPDRIKDQVAE